MRELADVFRERRILSVKKLFLDEFGLDLDLSDIDNVRLTDGSEIPLDMRDALSVAIGVFEPAIKWATTKKGGDV